MKKYKIVLNEKELKWLSNCLFNCGYYDANKLVLDGCQEYNDYEELKEAGKTLYEKVREVENNE